MRRESFNLTAFLLSSIIVIFIIISLGELSLAPKNMGFIPAGKFIMGANESYSLENERPAHAVFVDGFFIDKNLVTNNDFQRFVDRTGYVTTAERPPKWEELKKQLPPSTRKPESRMLVPGSLVFKAPRHPVSLHDVSDWWHWTPGANWRQPEGPGSDLKGRERHPVVHVSYDDAKAYAQWIKKRLPTEAEWEYAARGGLLNQRYAWGNDLKPGNRFMANTFQGHFPHKQTAEDGYAGTSPIGSYPENGYGLFDMAGNVWEWTNDWYRDDAYKHNHNHAQCKNPRGPTSSVDHRDPYAQKRVIKGGSFLCHPQVCEGFRPSARRGETPDTGTSHIGFRLVQSPKI